MSALAVAHLPVPRSRIAALRPVPALPELPVPVTISIAGGAAAVASSPGVSRPAPSAPTSITAGSPPSRAASAVPTAVARTEVREPGRGLPDTTTI